MLKNEDNLSKVVVFGNGESRSDIDLNQFKDDYITVGCNAIHRDIVVNHLVCCDRRMVIEAANNPNYTNSLIYVREDNFQFFRKVQKNKTIQVLPTLPYEGTKRADKPIHWGSGPYAVLVAASLQPTEVHMYGFDLYGDKFCVNNIYKGTPNYASKESNAVDPSYWIYQISRVFFCFPNITFKVYNFPDWKIPESWKQTNVEILEIDCTETKYSL